jgi:hypothetical protein
MDVRSRRPVFIHSLLGCRGLAWLPAVLPAGIVHSAVAQTVVTGGDPATVITAADLETAGTLSFVQGDGDPGILQVTTSGTFTNSWSMTDAIGLFNLTGTSLTIASAVPHAGNTATGSCTIGVQGGTLTLGQNSFLTGFTGTLQVSGLGILVVEQVDWLTNTSLIGLNSNAGTSTFTWGGSTAATYAGALDLSTGATPGEVVISTTQDTGTLTLTGAISGTSDLRLEHATGVTATPTITLGLTGGFTGRTIIDGANVRIDTQESIGSVGLTIDGGTLTAGTGLTIGATQAFAVEGTSAMAGAGGSQTFTVDGSMSGTGTLSLTDIAMTVGSGATSTFTGGITLDTGSSLAVANAAFVEQLGALQFDDTAAVEYSGTSAATFDGTLTLGANGTIRTSGASVGALTLSGAVSGTGDLTLEHSAATTDPTIVLALTGGFTGQTIIDSANVRIDTQESIGSTGLTLDAATLTAGTSLTIGASQALVVTSDSTIAGTTAGGLTALAVDGQMQGTGNLTLDGMSMSVNGTTTSYSGNVALVGGSALSVSNGDWLAAVGAISMNDDGAATSFTYTGTSAGSFGGTLEVGAGTATISTTENFTLNGTVTGAGDLLVTRSAGSTAEVGLGFTASTLTGTTIISNTAARVLTSTSIGDAGLTLAGGNLVVDAAVGSLTIGAAQDFTVSGVSSIEGTGGASALTLEGEMAGSGTLTVTDIAMNVNGTTSAFTGGVTLATGSSLAVANAAWLQGAGALNFDASATVDYSGTTAETYDGAIRLSTDPLAPADATFRTSGAGAGALTLSGFASGTGDLVLSTTSGSTAGFTLALTGAFTGATIVNDADVTINTQNSVGSAGLELNDLTATTLNATVGTSLNFGDSQSLSIVGTVNLGGSAANSAINAQGGLRSSGAATLNLDDIALTVGDGTASTFTGDVSLTDGASFILDGANLSGTDVTSIVAGDAVTFGGIGTIGSIGDGGGFSGTLRLGDEGVSATSVLGVTGSASLAAAAILQSHLLESTGTGTGTADKLSLGGSFAAGGATANLIYDPAVFTGTLIPVPGQTVTYTVIDATGGVTGSFGAVNLVTIDPVTGLPTTRPLNPETDFLGGTFSFDYSGNTFTMAVQGFGGPGPLPVPGTTDTNVVVPVQVGSSTINRNANVGIAQNSQINASAIAMNALAADPLAPADDRFVASQLLLQSDAAAYASAVVAVSAPTNPQALPTTFMLGMFEANDVAMKRLMQLRPRSAAAAPEPDAPRQRGTGGPRSTAVATRTATPKWQAFGAELNGPTPDEGIRGWARGFGWTASFGNQGWAQTSYDSTFGNAAVGADVVVGDGGILGGFVGYVPGSVNVTGGLVDESMTINGVNFGAYGSWVPNRDNWYLSGAVSGAVASVDRTRSLYIPGAVRTATASSNAWSLSASAETGINLRCGGDSYLSPYVRAAYAFLSQGSYNESGAGSMDLSVGEQQGSGLQPSVGVRYMDGIRSGRSVITPFVGGGFTAFVPLGDWSVTATNVFSGLPQINVYGSGPDTLWGGTVEAGVEWALPEGFTFYASFNAMFLSDAQVYGGQVGFVIPF